MDWQKKLNDPAEYLMEIESLEAKSRTSFRTWTFELGDRSLELSPRDIFPHKKTLAQKLARDVRLGTYQPEPAWLKTMKVDKLRQILHLTFIDRIVHGVVARAVEQCLSSSFSKHLYSYQRGVSPHHATQALLLFLKQHKIKNPDKKKRGLFVFQTDIRQYTESIPVNAKSSLWKMLEKPLGFNSQQSDPKQGTPEWLLMEVVAPTIRDETGTIAKMRVGIPTGSPISPVIANLYLSDLDHQVSNIGGGFYARYGDDLIFIHDKQKSVLEAKQLIETHTHELGLELHPKKTRSTYWTGSGFIPASLSTEFPLLGSQHLKHLGYHLGFDGCVSLNTEKLQQTMNEIEKRLNSLMRTIPISYQDRGQAICFGLAEALKPDSSVAIPYAQALSRTVTDRNQLRWLDRWLELKLAQAITGISGVKSLRKISPRLIRERWGLVSLERQRNA